MNDKFYVLNNSKLRIKILKTYLIYLSMSIKIDYLFIINYLVIIINFK